MSVLNQVAYVRPHHSVAAEFVEKLSGEGFSCAVLTPDNDFLAQLGQAQPAAILIDPGFSPPTLSEIIPNIKERFPYVPIVLVTSAPIANLRETPIHIPVDGVCHTSMPSVHIAITLRGIIRSAFMIQDLLLTNRKLNEKSITDSLTGLYNRGHMIDRLNLEWKRAERNREILSCVMIDIDHFKIINDNYGHKFGDCILKAVSARTKSLIRVTDIFGRYGGEEFLVILPNTNLEGAGFLSEKLRAGLEESKFQQDCFSLLVTASYGVASTENTEVITADHLLQLSDRALYQAKESGRNHVCIAGKSDRKVLAATEGAPPDLRHRIDVLAASATPNPFVRELENSSGYLPVVYTKEEEFLHVFKAEAPHLVFIDQNGMSPDSALALCGRIKQQIQDLFIPLVILVSDGDESMREQGLQAGADDVILPHVSVQAFMAHMELMSRLKNLHDHLRNTNKDLAMARDRLVRAERLNALGEMATGIAHDFNNILSAILGRTQLLRQKLSDTSVLKSLDVIEHAANDGAATIRRIQEFSRSTSAPSSITQIVDLAQIVRDAIQITRTLWKDQAEMQGIHYSFHANLNGRLTVQGSGSDLREVLINLIRNGIDAMPTGGAMRFDGNVIDDNVVLTVTDTGLGMNDEVQKRVFDPFFSTKKGGGTGLGLSVAYGIIMRHNGRIECFSEEGRGATFRIQLPFKPEFQSGAPAPAAEPLAAKPMRPLRILVVDDEEAVREVFSDILVQDGHVVMTTSSGKEAIGMVENERIDLLFTDLSMPEMSGWEVSRQARKISPNLTIVITSGWGKDFNQEQLTRHGVNCVLPKPVPFDTLQSLARQVAEGQSISMVP